MAFDPGEEIRVRVEVPRGGFAKRDATGRASFLSPLPCPFDYGSVPETTAPDGDEVDAVLLRGPGRRGVMGRGRVAGYVDFIDEGLADRKWIVVARGRLTRRDRWLVTGFFALYGGAKWAYRAAFERRTATHLERVVWFE